MVAKNPRRDIIVEELERWEVKIDGDFAGGKHRYIQAILGNGSRFKFHYSGGGKEHQLRNVRHDVRKQLAKLGQKLKPEIAHKIIKIRSTPPDITPRNVLPMPVTRDLPMPSYEYQEAPTQEKKMTTEPKTRNVMTQAQLGTAIRIMGANTLKTSEGIDYKEGFDDKRIAEMVSAAHSDRAAVTPGHIKRMRDDVFPDWVRPKRQSDGGISNLWARVNELTQRVQQLEDATTAPKTNGNGATLQRDINMAGSGAYKS